MSLWSTDNLYFYYSAEVLLSLYLLCFIFYTLILNNLINLSYPPLLASMVSATVFIIISIILLFAVNDGQITGNLLSNISNVTLLNLAFKVLLLLSVIMLQLVSRKILKSLLVFKYEYDLIIVFAILGLALLNECDDFLMFYLAIELQSLSFYCPYSHQNNIFKLLVRSFCLTKHSEFSAFLIKTNKMTVKKIRT